MNYAPVFLWCIGVSFHGRRSNNDVKLSGRFFLSSDVSPTTAGGIFSGKLVVVDMPTFSPMSNPLHKCEQQKYPIRSQKFIRAICLNKFNFPLEHVMDFQEQICICMVIVSNPFKNYYQQITLKDKWVTLQTEMEFLRTLSLRSKLYFTYLAR